MSFEEVIPAAKLAANTPHDQVRRLVSLRSYEILDTPRERQFDDIVNLAAYVCETPYAVINLIDETRQWFKAEVGFGVRETPLETSICAHAILQPGLFEVNDLRTDHRFACNPLVTSGPGLQFYAGALLQSPDGFALGTVCVLDTQPRTLTEQQKTLLLSLARQTMLQMELRKALSVATKANRYRARLMAIAGHDLKQPLQLVSLSLERLKFSNSRSSEDIIDAAQTAIFDMGQELDRLAVASKIGSAADTPKVQNFPVRALLDSIRSTWSEHAAHNNVQLSIVSSSCSVYSDPAMLRTILANLVGNAIKYSSDKKVLVGCRRRPHYLSIQVLDSGIGISPSHFEAIFQAFHQEDADSEGLGLGLTIVHSTAEALGCPIRVRSSVGRGSIFSVHVPYAAVQT